MSSGVIRGLGGGVVKYSHLAIADAYQGKEKEADGAASLFYTLESSSLPIQSLAEGYKLVTDAAVRVLHLWGFKSPLAVISWRLGAYTPF